MAENAVLVNFSGGETSPKSRGRFDAPWYQTAVRAMRNFIAEVTGPARFRPGFKFIRQTRAGAVARMVPFNVNNSAAYMLEFTPGFMRAYSSATKDLLTSTHTTITGITQANPAVVTVVSATGISNGDELILSGIVGMTQLNGRQVKVAGLSGSTFQLVDPTTGANINSTGFGAYASAGAVDKIYEITTSYDATALANLQWAQSNLTMYLVCATQAPQKLTVDSGGNFTLATFSRTNDPFNPGTSVLTVAGVTRGTRTYVQFAAGSSILGTTYTFSAVGGTTGLNGNTYTLVPVPSSAYVVTIVVTSSAPAPTTGDQITVNTISGFLSAVLAGNTYYLKKVKTVGNSSWIELYLDAGLKVPYIWPAAPNGDGNFAAYNTVGTATDGMTIYGVNQGLVDAIAPGLPTAYLLSGSSDVDSSGFGDWTSGGIATRTGAEHPIAVAFYEGRLWYLGTDQRPACIFGSRAPDSSAGNSRYDDFTGGTDADHACFFQLAPVGGSVDYISWGRGSPDYLFVGTFGGPYRVGGSGLDQPITPASINVRQFDTHGCEETMPVGLQQLFFIQRGGTTLRAIKVLNPYLATFESRDLCLNAEQIATVSPIKRAALQQGRPDVLWVCREDGSVAGFSVKINAQEAQEVTGWHQHAVGGASAKVLDLGVVQRSSGTDLLWATVERIIGGVTRRSVELLTDEVVFPDPEEYFTGDQAADLLAFLGGTYRRQEQYINLDAAATYDGSARGTAAAATLTPAAKTGTGITFTAGAGVFTAQDVGLQIWKKPNLATGLGGGRALITGYTSATVVTCKILEDFDSTAAIAAGDWYFAVETVYGAHHLEGETVAVVTDGAVYSDGGQSDDNSFPTVTVSGGAITLAGGEFAAVVHVGLPYLGYLETHNLEMGGKTGPAQDKPRNIAEMDIRFLNTLGVEFGTSPYRMTKVPHRAVDANSDRPAPVYSGIQRLKHEDISAGLTDTDREKRVVIMQRLPLPATVQFIDVYYDGEE